MWWTTEEANHSEEGSHIFYLIMEKKTRKSPVPANADRITEGALKLPLEQRIDLNKTLSKSITEEMAAAKNKIEELQMKLNGVK